MSSLDEPAHAHAAKPGEAATRARVGLRRLARLAAGGAILALLFRKVPLAEVASVLRGCDLGWALAGLALSLLAHWLVALRLRVIADHHALGLSTAQLFEINLVARFYGLFVPAGSVGAIAIRVFQLGQLRGRLSAATIAIAMDRVVATLALALVGACFWLLDAPPRAEVWLIAMGVVVAALGVPIALVLAGARELLPAAVHRALPSQLARRVERLIDELASWREMRAAAAAHIIALSLLAHLLGVAGFGALAAAIDMNAPLVSLGWIRSAMMLAAMLPISVAGIGVREGAALLTLPALGVAGPQAIGFSLLVFAVTTLAVGAIGGLAEARRLWAQAPR
ncbi:MAG TPA: lysylphosphatidylglycerol synthase transmembrane domain-containing protein [Myxococcota bacterium]|nr:lysylphosphatidylglycerol synthase transmembrane domain-containing protein [Myxococcota bacterium]